jgi:glycosyltransferase involved in cell wall biosynthesis
MPPLVSIVTPVYNGARFLAATLECVRQQSYAAWEHIVVDDGSTDDTSLILARYALQQPLRVLAQANGGAARARNTGLEAASGVYAVFLDADDVWPPDFLAQMVRALEAAPEAVAAYAGWQYMDEAGTRLPQVWRADPAGAEQLRRDLYWRNALVPSAVLVRRAAVMQAQGFDARLLTAEDWDLWLRLLEAGPFVPVPGAIMFYRNHNSNLTNDLEAMERGRLKMLEKHHGSLSEPLAQWPEPRRQCIGYTYFNTALGYLRQGEAAPAQAKLQQAVETWPGLLQEAELYYELACAYQPRGWRGTAAGLRLNDSARLIREVIATNAALLPGSRPAELWGFACLVLAQLAATNHDRAAARRFALQALRRAEARYRWPAMRLLGKSSLPAGVAQALGRARAARPA